MLTVAAIRNALCHSFSAKRVRGCFYALRAAGIVPRGVTGRNGSAKLTTHDAMLALLVAALDSEGNSNAALRLAMRVRSWRVVEPAAGYGFRPGCAIGGVSDIRLSSALIAQFQTRRPSPWLFSPVECVGAGLAFAPAASGPVPARVARRYSAVDAALIADIAALCGPLETQRQMAVLLLERVERVIRSAPVRAERQLVEGAQ